MRRTVALLCACLEPKQSTGLFSSTRMPACREEAKVQQMAACYAADSGALLGLSSFAG